ncbi:glycoside hydrolase family 2 protein [Flexithrix dorotheae]|uniref:glycoside hydrolase family 2 protein n=1 Tax=Flexithrix dorotheae TaxID=70993 RepID=UPI00037DB6CE|nr:glycoside hydrolase family 2 [Flexithrix dorotheae]
MKKRTFSTFILFIISLHLFSQTPRPEHPKPQFEREKWMNLNGEWDFAIDFGVSGVEQKWYEDPSGFDEKIIVPFCPESKLSGIEYKDFMPSVWYHRKISIPADWDGERIFLNFGAVDYDCRVWVNGQQVGRHYGGSTSFSFEITNVLKAGENTLVVNALDDIRSKVQPSGKQSPTFYNTGCCKYTRVTGIWQTVWLEARGKQHLEQVRVVPDLDNSQFVVTPIFSGYADGVSFQVILTEADGKEVVKVNSTSGNGMPIPLKLKKPKLWSPESPYLYKLKFQILKNGQVVDEVKSYAGMRKVHIDGNKIYVNNKPVFMRLVLDQGFYPEGVWTAPSDEELKADIERSMAVGFNGARLHEKVFEERFHYWADKLGYLTWGEYPDWGVSRSYISPMAFINFKREWQEAMVRDMNHPSIIAWTPLNETHSPKKGLEEYTRAVLDIYDLTQQLDPTRPINDASGFLHIKTDIFTVHDYDQNLKSMAERYSHIRPDNPDVYQVSWDWYGTVKDYDVKYLGQPYVVDEYGGTFWLPEYAKEAAKGKGRREWGYGKSAEEVIKLIADLTKVLTDNPNIAGYTYTQLTDVEQEVNGIYTYDRKLKFDADKLKAIFGAPAAMEKEEAGK